MGYSDNDWEGSQDDRRSTTGWVFSLGSSVVAWCSKKQPITTLSTTKIEYVSVTTAACEAVQLSRFLQDLDEIQGEAMVILCHNRSAISVIKNPIHSGHTKHIDIHYYFIRGLMKNGEIEVKHCSTDLQLADIFTKALPKAKFEFFLEEQGVKEFSD